MNEYTNTSKFFGMKNGSHDNGEHGRVVSSDKKYKPEDGKFFTMLCGPRPERDGDYMFSVDVCFDGDEMFVALPCSAGDTDSIVDMNGMPVKKIAENDYKGAIAALIISVELGVMKGVAGAAGLKLKCIKFSSETHSWCSFWTK